MRVDVRAGSVAGGTAAAAGTVHGSGAAAPAVCQKAAPSKATGPGGGGGRGTAAEAEDDGVAERLLAVAVVPALTDVPSAGACGGGGARSSAGVVVRLVAAVDGVSERLRLVVVPVPYEEGVVERLVAADDRPATTSGAKSTRAMAPSSTVAANWKNARTRFPTPSEWPRSSHLYLGGGGR